MNPAPLISCIIPVYNGARYLAEALDSVLAQTYQPLEIIVVDDGSTDDSAEVAAGYGERVRVCQQSNTGPGGARNRGLAEATAEFIAFLDADDLWHAEKLARQMARFEARPELELCTTHVKNFWIPELAHEQRRLQDHRFSRELPGYVCQTLMARRDLFSKIGSFDDSLRIGEDADWFSRARDHEAVMEVLPEVLVYRRMHGKNISYNLYQDAGKEDQLKVVIAALKRRRQQSGAD